MVSVLESAAVHGHRSHDCYADEYDEAILDLRLGGGRLVFARAHGRCGGPSERQIKRFAKLPPYISLYVSGSIEVDLQIIRRHMERHLFSRPWPSDKPCVLHILQMDAINGSKRARISDHDGCVRGVCHHMKGLLDPKRQGPLRHSDHANVAIAANAEKGYKPVIVATSGGCLSNDPPERTQRLIELTVRVWTQDERGEKLRGPLSTLQPDGASGFAKLSHRMFFDAPMEADHPLYDLLSPLQLYNLYVARDDRYKGIRPGCELKH
eukprot:2902831-Prymnesium_polylepis.1